MSYCRSTDPCGYYIYPTAGSVSFNQVHVDDKYLDILIYLLAMKTIDKDKTFEKDMFQKFLIDGKNLLVGENKEIKETSLYTKHIKMPYIGFDEEDMDKVVKCDIDLTISLDDKTITFDANNDKTVILTDEFKVFLYVLSKRPEELLRRYHHGLTMMYRKNFYDKLIISF